MNKEKEKKNRKPDLSASLSLSLSLSLYTLMSRLTPTQSPSVLNERYFRSTNTASPSPTGNPGPSKRSILLSENQLNNVTRQNQKKSNTCTLL